MTQLLFLVYKVFEGEADETALLWCEAQYGRTDILNQGGFNYSVAKTAQVFAGFNWYFDTSFPISKLESVAVPTKGEAMENFAPILYWEADFLVFLEGETTK